MRRSFLAVALALCALPAIADCIANGHYTLTDTPFPYTENLTRPWSTPIANGIVVAYHDDGRWTKVQTGCASYDEKNINASTRVNLLLRASMRVNQSGSIWPRPGTRMEVQLRVGETADAPRFVSAHTRVIEGREPVSLRFGSAIQGLDPGNYVYSMWVRVLDGPESNRVNLDLQWITAQGTPARFPSERATAGEVVVTTEWAPVADQVTIATRRPLDLALQSSFMAEGDAEALQFRWGAEGRVATVALRAGESIFDQIPSLPPGLHRIQLWARTTSGSARLKNVVVEAAGFPLENEHLDMPAMVEASSDEPIEATALGDDEQPIAPILQTSCGRWTKLLELETKPMGGDPSWMLSGYVEFLGYEVSGAGQLAIETIFRDGSVEASTDMGSFDFNVRRERDGLYFYGDASKWGNWGEGGNLVRLWVRRMEGCNFEPFGGGFTIGRRWLAVKLLPSPGPHLP